MGESKAWWLQSFANLTNKVHQRWEAPKKREGSIPLLSLTECCLESPTIGNSCPLFHQMRHCEGTIARGINEDSVPLIDEAQKPLLFFTKEKRKDGTLWMEVGLVKGDTLMEGDPSTPLPELKLNAEEL